MTGMIVRYCMAILLCTLLCARGINGDAIVVTKAMSATTIAEVFIEDDSVRIEMEIGAEDIAAFQNLLPDEIYERFEFTNSLDAQARIERFFTRDMPLLADGKILPGTLLASAVRKRIQRDEITGQPLQQQPADAELVIYAKFAYRLDEQPETLSIRPPRAGEQGRVSANIGFMTYHRGLPVMDFRYLSQEEILDLDWQDPWYSRFRNRNLRRQYDAPLSVFLYVEPFEVRAEVVIRPVDLQRWTDLGISAGQIIPVSRQKQLKSQVAEFLTDKIEVTIDGRPAHGEFDRIHFISRSLRKTGVIYPDQDLHASAATLGVIFVYPIQQLPKTVTMKWELFDDKIDQVPATATDEAGGLPSTLSAGAPILEWKNFLTNPTIPAMRSVPPPSARPKWVLSIISIAWAMLACVAALLIFRSGASRRWQKMLIPAFLLVVGLVCLPFARIAVVNPFAKPTTVRNQQANQIIDSLLHNVYHAFDRRQESLVYDQLEHSLSGDLLKDVYLQTRRRIRLADQGGAQVKIDNVQVLSNQIESQDDKGFAVQTSWIASGTVGHWGHLHRRQLGYLAEFEIQPIDNVWKITSMKITDESQPELSPDR